ncbi:hypothetical protein LC612_28555 [Nostoc sp. CHAB 5834]|nr:hypothetical protein [Nostoc sp. CHAB 5834]
MEYVNFWLAPFVVAFIVNLVLNCWAPEAKKEHKKIGDKPQYKKKTDDKIDSEVRRKKRFVEPSVNMEHEGSSNETSPLLQAEPISPRTSKASSNLQSQSPQGALDLAMDVPETFNLADYRSN